MTFNFDRKTAGIVAVSLLIGGIIGGAVEAGMSDERGMMRDCIMFY